MSETLRFVERLGRIYRVLIEELNGYWLIDCDTPSPPFFEADCAKYDRVPTPESWMTEQTTPAQAARLHMIQPLLDCDDCISDKALRYRMAAESAQQHQTTTRRILRLYYRYLATGRLIQKRAKQISKNSQIIAQAIRHYYFGARRLSLRSAYEMMLLEDYVGPDGQLDSDAPTWSQFRHYYYEHSFHKSPQKIIAREGLTKYQRDHRPVWGSSAGWRPQPGSYQMDATQADIYLVSRQDRSVVVGRPYIYLAVDTATHLVAGIYVGFVCDETAVMACILQAASDKVEYCAHYGIDITSEQWPSVGMPSDERRSLLPSLASIYVPMPYQYAIYDTLYRAISTTYRTADVVESTRAINAYYRGQSGNYATQADSGSILGAPGGGKTAAIRRCLSVMPQTIEHTEYQGQPFFCKQVLYLVVECPSDCSVKTLGFSIMAALDKAIGSHYLQSTQGLRSASASAIAVQTKILLTNHNVGLLVIDEIQNAVMTARKNRQEKPLLRFLVELTNEPMTSVYFVGTPVAEELFVSQEHLKRRTRGIRLAPFKPDGAYLDFLSKIWPYQFTQRMAELTSSISNKLYDHSGGIPAYIIKIFSESQAQALLQGRACIDEKVIQRTVETLAIKVPRTYTAGTHISDFEIGGQVPEPPPELEELPRQYANKRGRKAVQRDCGDLLVAYNNGIDLEAHLQENGYLEADYHG